jgi:3-(3-hydroxy-phenyl)propionate hydroxylase
LLGQRGLRVWIGDSTRDIYDKPRAFAMDHEILRVLQQLGVDGAMQAHMEPFTDSEFYGVDGQLIKCMSTIAPPYPLGHPPSVVFNQPALERLLRQLIAKLPSVTSALGHQVQKVENLADGVRLSVLNDQGVASTVHAHYAIACDGASSRVREQLGVGLIDLGFDQAWLVVDALINPQGLAKLPQVSVQYCEPARPSTFLIGPGHHRRWEISINPDEDPQELATPEGTWRLLQRWITPQDGQLWRQASYRFHALVAREWRQGRVFLAGDAAHQQPPFLGQGMCQGVRDVVNLSWKLAACLQDHAPDALLDTYATERQAHVRELTTRIKHIGELIAERDLSKARARDQQLLQACQGQVQRTPRQDVQPALRGGLLSAQAHAAVGTLCPQPWWVRGAQRQRMDQALGCGWRLLLSAQAPASLLTTAAQYRPAGMAHWQVGQGPWQETDGVLAHWFAKHQAHAVMVRPDHVVYGVAHDGPSLQALFDEIHAFSKPN